MRDLPEHEDNRLLVGSSTADDAGVFRLSDQCALVQTLDFFTPIVDDPFLFGQIAATNSLSDVYAMGGRPITAMAIAGMPSGLSIETIREIFRGGAEVVKRAECSLVGGHTIKNQEPIYGLSVTGVVAPDAYLENGAAKQGDFLILTKPLGTGIISQALKMGKGDESLQNVSIQSMIALNQVGAHLGEERLVHACTDITGFGFLGHLLELCQGSKLTAEIIHQQVPCLDPSVLDLIKEGCVPGGTRKNLENVQSVTRFSEEVSEEFRLLLADAQTSGGLLLSVPEEHVSQVQSILGEQEALCAEVIGQVKEPGDYAIEVR